MKQLMKVLILSSLIAAFAFISQPPSLTGRWRFRGPDGSIAYVDFKADSTFNYHTLMGQTIHAGTYKVVDDVLFVSDPDCGDDEWGKYKLNFITADSVSFKLFEDDCPGRAQQVDGTGLARVKE